MQVPDHPTQAGQSVQPAERNDSSLPLTAQGGDRGVAACDNDTSADKSTVDLGLSAGQKDSEVVVPSTSEDASMPVDSKEDSADVVSVGDKLQDEPKGTQCAFDVGNVGVDPSDPDDLSDLDKNAPAMEVKPQTLTPRQEEDTTKGECWVCSI